MKEITVSELRKLTENKESFQLIDVREQHEFDEVNMNGEHIPMQTLVQKPEVLNKDIPVVIHCKSGQRSANVIRLLESKYGYTNLYNLKGGIIAWLESQ